MATSELVKELVDAGFLLVKTLDQQGVKVGTAFWVYEEEKTGEWRLVLSMPLVDEKGSAAAQDSIAGALKTAGIKHLYLRQIVATSPRDPLVSAITRDVHARAKAAKEGVRLTRSTIGNQWIDEVYVYRST